MSTSTVVGRTGLSAAVLSASLSLDSSVSTKTTLGGELAAVSKTVVGASGGGLLPEKPEVDSVSAGSDSGSTTCVDGRSDSKPAEVELK